MTNHALTPSSVSIEIINGQPTTTSLDVAAHFGKRHDRVLDKIRNLDCSTEFRLHNFVEASQDVPQPNGGVAKYPIFRMTRDGFTFLCMGFTGKEAAKWKEAYINAFNQMEASLLRSDSTSKRKPKALPNGLTIDQQDAIKALVRARVEATPKDKQAKAAITCWSALKSKFGCTYKQIAPDQYAEAVSLVARLPLEGEYIPHEDPATCVLDQYEAQDLSNLLHYTAWIHYRWKQGISDAVKALNPKFHAKTWEFFESAHRAAERLERARPDFRSGSSLRPHECLENGRHPGHPAD